MPFREAALGAGFDLERVGRFLPALSVNAHGNETAARALSDLRETFPGRRWARPYVY